MNKLNRKNLVIGTTILIAAIMIISLFALRIGVSDNGMQYKLLEKLGLYDAYQTSGTGYYSDGFGIADKSFTKASYGLVYDLAKQLFPVDGILYTALPAALYLLIFVCSAMLLLFSLYSEKFKGMSVTACLLFVFMFCDSAYAAYFNTPYKHAAFFVYVIAVIAMFTYSVKMQKIWSLILYGVFACLFANTSTVAAIVSVILGVYSFRLTCVNKSYCWKIISVLLGIAVVFVGITSVSSDVDNMYDSVFYGAALEDSSVIAKLGLDKEFENYIEVPSFDEKAQAFINSPEFEEYSSEIKAKDVAGYYFKNIPLLFKGLKKVGYNSTAIRTSYLSGFAPSSGKAGANTGFFTVYSSVKAKALPTSLVFFLIVVFALIAVSFIYRNNYAKEKYEKILSEFCAVFSLCTIIIFPVPYILSGMTQIGFNMFYFNVMFDITLFMLVISTINLLITKKNILKEKYGVNQ